MIDWRKLLKRRGDRIRADEWNALVELASGNSFAGPRAMTGGMSTVVRPPPKGDGSSGAGNFAMVVSKTGTLPPFTYSCEEATMSVTGVWTKVTDGKVYTTCFNYQEQGAGGQWVNPIVVDDVVHIEHAPDQSVDAYVISRDHYRGTY